MDVAVAKAVLEAAVARNEVPGAVAVVGDKERIVLVTACGVTRLGGPNVVPETRYDLASLSKVIGTLPAVLKLVESGEISLESPVKSFFSQAGWFQTPSLGDVTLSQLLTHSSGLPAWQPLYAAASTQLTALGSVLQTGLEHPAGRVVYSDVGFMLLGAVAERVSGIRLDTFTQEHIFEPLGMSATAYGVPAGASVAATEDCGWRGRLLEGEVHDENAFVFGGVAGHAGLFGTAADVARYAQAWLRLETPFASPDLLALAVREHVRDGDLRRGLGWQLAGGGSSAGNSSAGTHASSATYGHTGFTGTSVWVDPERERFAVLLTNRVHPSRLGGEGIHALRVGFHDAVFGDG